ncbi:hypothetical protein BC940DRAFT_310112 [Gongronella butleri]|nr:hypothetical protein BC940DRAFT_310112 [Gongronella butleri]
MFSLDRLYVRIQDRLCQVLVPFLEWVYNTLPLLSRFLVTPCQAAMSYRRRHAPERELLHQLQMATTHDSWYERADALDQYAGRDAWQYNAKSNFYDYRQIAARLQQLIEARKSDNPQIMMELLRGGLLRNYCGIADRRLFSHALSGTKHLIENYIDEVVAQLELIEDTPHVSPQAKLKFFSDTQRVHGSTALVLQGTTALALYHLGVIKALSEQGLLPRIISGTAVSAMIASLICIHTDDELPHFLQPDGINLTAFSKKSDKGHFRRRVTRFLKYGYLMDMKVLQECVRANVGDLTFEEAYARSKRVLNISVSSSRKHEVPQQLNYMTAPNVLIWSAACCSTASAGLFATCDLLAKDKSGNIVKWNSSDVKWTRWKDVSCDESESPLHRLSELFNVNHFIVSQAVFYVIPFISNVHDTLWSKLIYLMSSELRHRLYQLRLLHMLPHEVASVIEQKMSGDINILPQLSLTHLNIIFSNPTYASLTYWIQHGEKSTWPLLSLLNARCKIEIALDNAVARLQARNVMADPVVVASSRPPMYKRRAKSMH